ncbi:RNA polymerase sigma24 factor [Planotetraspora thailandica]|uniref:RNA polymerase sigma24 factor n=1 Tax=Planotetraspora thailandica TaxID=487172 RepID=A0A8J3VEL8_9ACTN|nr:RNA polymerase sigma factor [Planotetraspora thailandica]GII56790.1 RNA polymerase sigma24 factor [Planotetraspora thailandica]
MPEADQKSPGPALPADDVVVAALRLGDEEMFAALLSAWSPGMLQVARAYVADDHAAEDVVQEAWLGVLRGIDRFEARSSLRTWIYRIVINKAKTRGVRDARTVPMTSLTPEKNDAGLSIDFHGPESPYPDARRRPPVVWPSPEGEILAHEVHEHIVQALDNLPARQRVVITLRDVQGYTSDEVCAILEITAANQRVLLHRARASLRSALDRYMTAPSGKEPTR